MLDLMRTHIVILALVALSPLTTHAGGDSFVAEIVSLTPEAKDEYRLELVQYSPPYGGKGERLPAHFVIHLRFSERMFARTCPVCPTKGKYLAAIESLKVQAAKGGKFPFGIMSDGFEPIKGRKGEFQSNALCILKEFSGREVVYSFARPT
jgi:hypothetical protein